MGCGKSVSTGVERVSHAQADAIETWSERNHRPHKFLFTQRAELGVTVPPTWITVVDHEIVAMNDRDGARVDSKSSVFRTIDNLHRVLAEELIRYEARITAGLDDEHSVYIKASFDKSTGVPLRLTWDVHAAIDDEYTWQILGFEFLDE